MAKIEIELQDVLDFIDNSTEDDFNKIYCKVLKNDDYIKDLEEEKEELEDENEDLRDIIDRLEEKIDDNKIEGFEINTLYDEMKLKLLKIIMKKYSLEELENKLGTEHKLSIGIKK